MYRAWNSQQTRDRHLNRLYLAWRKFEHYFRMSKLHIVRSRINQNSCSNVFLTSKVLRPACSRKINCPLTWLLSSSENMWWAVVTQEILKVRLRLQKVHRLIFIMIYYVTAHKVNCFSLISFWSRWKKKRPSHESFGYGNLFFHCTIWHKIRLFGQ